MSVGLRIKNRRKQLKLSADKLGETIGKNRATVYRYESDEIENMPLDILPSLAEALRVSPSYLMGWEEMELEDLSTDYDFIPIPVAAGSLTTIDGITENNIKKMTVPDSIMGKYAGNRDVFLMRVNGDSMNKIIPHDSMIAVKKTNVLDLQNNDIVVFSDENEYSVKRYFNDVDNRRIIFSAESEDRRFTDYIVPYEETENLTIHGKVALYIVTPD